MADITYVVGREVGQTPGRQRRLKTSQKGSNHARQKKRRGAAPKHRGGTHHTGGNSPQGNPTHQQHLKDLAGSSGVPPAVTPNQSVVSQEDVFSTWLIPALVLAKWKRRPLGSRQNSGPHDYGVSATHTARRERLAPGVLRSRGYRTLVPS